MRTPVRVGALLAALAGIAWYVWLVVSGALETNYVILFMIAVFLLGLGSGLISLLFKKPAESGEKTEKGKAEKPAKKKG